MTTHVFCGPTIGPETVRRILPEAVAHPPIRHGDALRLRVGPGDAVLIVDGLFHQSAAVRHKEILELIAAGATVVGCSSMGALRAAELDRYGMVGVGEVYRGYAEGRTDADADVAVIHTPEGAIEQLSEALVDLESRLVQARREAVIDEAERAALASALRETHYTERGPASLARLDAPGAEAFRSWLAGRSDAPGAKRRDALEALRLLAAGRIEAPPPGSWTERRWRTEFLAGWVDRHTGTVHEGRHVSRLACHQYRQVFDPDFPRWWRARVLAWIAGAPGPDHGEQAAERARRVAVDSGLRVADLTPRQRRHWLTAAEDAELGAAEALERILVRSAGSGATVPGRDWPEPELDAATVAAVAHAYAVNDRAAESGVAVHALSAEAVGQYLRGLWGLEGATAEERTAAARDRGFRGFAGAVGVCRQFILARVGERLWRRLGPRSTVGDVRA